MNFFSILIIYSRYFSLELIYTFNILIQFIIVFSISLILINIYILKPLGFLTKYINSYFFKANFALYIFNYFLYFLQIFLNILQLRSVKSSYVKIYILLIKINDNIYKASLFIIIKRFYTKKRKRINKINNPYKIPIFIFISFIFLLQTFIIIIFSQRKLLIYYNKLFRIFRFFILLNRRAYET